MKAKGWAAIRHGEILVKTVQDSRIGAMVNYIVTYARWPVSNNSSDADIEVLFDRLREQSGVRVVECTITVKK